jgi:hypothetical protein
MQRDPNTCHWYLREVERCRNLPWRVFSGVLADVAQGLISAYQIPSGSGLIDSVDYDARSRAILDMARRMDPRDRDVVAQAIRSSLKNDTFKPNSGRRELESLSAELQKLAGKPGIVQEPPKSARAKWNRIFDLPVAATTSPSPAPARPHPVRPPAAGESPNALLQKLQHLRSSRTAPHRVPGKSRAQVKAPTLEDPIQSAEALLAQDSVEIGERDLIELLKYPCCVGNHRSAILARLGRLLKPPTAYTSVWTLLDDLKRRSPDLYEFAKVPPERPSQPPAEGTRPGSSAPSTAKPVGE